MLYVNAICLTCHGFSALQNVHIHAKYLNNTAKKLLTATGSPIIDFESIIAI